MAIVVGLGEVLWDIFTTEKVLGGAPCNFALHARALGADSYIVSSVGNDRLGDDVKEILDSFNQKYYFTPSREKTGAVLIDTDSEGVASYIFRENCAYDNIVLTPEIEDLAKKTDCVCFGSLAQREKVSRDSIYKFLDLTPASCIKIFDINLRSDYFSKEIIESSLKRANVLKINEDEWPLLLDMFQFPTDEELSLKRVKEYFKLDLIILTKGSHGSLLYRSEDEFSVEKPRKVRVVDTVGAGDSFTAAVAIGLLEGQRLRDINQRANEVAANVCTQKGGFPRNL